MIIPCFIVLSLSGLAGNKISVNAKKIHAIKRDTFSFTEIQVNNKIYSVTETPDEVKTKIKTECGK